MTAKEAMKIFLADGGIAPASSEVYMQRVLDAVFEEYACEHARLQGQISTLKQEVYTHRDELAELRKKLEVEQALHTSPTLPQDSGLHSRLNSLETRVNLIEGRMRFGPL